MKEKTRRAWGRFIGMAVFVTLLGSAVYAAIGAAAAPPGHLPAEAHGKLRSDYVLMLLECLVGLVVMFLPSMLERRLRIAIPGGMYVVFVVFLYAAIYLGEIRSFYYRIPNWDTILHAMSGVMLAALGFSIVSVLNDSEKVAVSLSPLFVALFAFSFAVSLGALWEIYEFAADGILGLNMQKFALEGGAPLLGRAALEDTMGDLIVDSLAALVVSAGGFAAMKAEKGWLARVSIKRREGGAS